MKIVLQFIVKLIWFLHSWPFMGAYYMQINKFENGNYKS